MNLFLGATVLPLALDPRPDDSQVGPGLLGFLMFLFLAVATVLLWLSLRRHLKKVRFEEAPARPRRTVASRSAAGPATGDVEQGRPAGGAGSD